MYSLVSDISNSINLFQDVLFRLWIPRLQIGWGQWWTEIFWNSHFPKIIPQTGIHIKYKHVESDLAFYTYTSSHKIHVHSHWVKLYSMWLYTSLHVLESFNFSLKCFYFIFYFHVFLKIAVAFDRIWACVRVCVCVRSGWQMLSSKTYLPMDELFFFLVETLINTIIFLQCLI